MTEKNGSDTVIFINGRIETSANFASRYSLDIRHHTAVAFKYYVCAELNNCFHVRDLLQ